MTDNNTTSSVTITAEESYHSSSGSSSLSTSPSGELADLPLPGTSPIITNHFPASPPIPVRNNLRNNKHNQQLHNELSSSFTHTPDPSSFTPPVSSHAFRPRTNTLLPVHTQLHSSLSISPQQNSPEVNNNNSISNNNSYTYNNTQLPHSYSQQQLSSAPIPIHPPTSHSATSQTPKQRWSLFSGWKSNNSNDNNDGKAAALSARTNNSQRPRSHSQIVHQSDDSANGESIISPSSSSWAMSSPFSAFSPNYANNNKAPPGVPSSLISRFSSYLSDISSLIEDYKLLLTKSSSRRRVVVSQLESSLARITACMQLEKMHALQQIISVQEQVFEKEEQMLRTAVIVLKEKLAQLKSMQDDLMDSTPSSQQQHNAIEAATQAVATPPKQLCMQHPLLIQLSNEHKSFGGKLDELRNRYTKASRRTEEEESVERRVRVHRVVQKLIERYTSQSAPQLPNSATISNPISLMPAESFPVASPLSMHASFSTALSLSNSSNSSLPSIPSMSISPPVPNNNNGSSTCLDYSPARDLELEFARLILDERTAEGKRIKQFVNAVEEKHRAHRALTVQQKTSKQQLNGSLISASSSYSGSDTPSSVTSTTPSLPHSSSFTTFVDSDYVAARVAAALSPYESLSLISTFFQRFESQLIKDYTLTSAQRPYVKLLIQRTIFPRIWHVCIHFGNISKQPELQNSSDSSVNAGSGGMDDEELIQHQMSWLKNMTPLQIGVPPNLCTPAPTLPDRIIVPDHTARPKHHTDIYATPSKSIPSHPPKAPDTSFTSPSSLVSPGSRKLRPYTNVISVIEELGQLIAPLDMLSCLLSASKMIYQEANQYMQDYARYHSKSPVTRSPGTELLSADSFFPLFCYIVIQSSVSHWIARLHLMQEFALTDNISEAAYYLTTLEAALLFIKTANKQEIEGGQLMYEQYPTRKRSFENALAMLTPLRSASSTVHTPQPNTPIMRSQSVSTNSTPRSHHDTDDEEKRVPGHQKDFSASLQLSSTEHLETPLNLDPAPLTPKYETLVDGASHIEHSNGTAAFTVQTPSVAASSSAQERARKPKSPPQRHFHLDANAI